MRVPIGMVHGRFQPFHNGHLQYCLEAAARCDRLVVGLTNPDPSRVEPEPDDPARSMPAHNPFPYHLRARMVQLSLAEAGLDLSSVLIVPFPIHHLGLWPSYVPPTAVQFMRVYSRWAQRKVERLRAAGYEVVDLTAGRGKEVSGTAVRARWRTGDDWSSLVPPAVARLLQEEGSAS